MFCTDINTDHKTAHQNHAIRQFEYVDCGSNTEKSKLALLNAGTSIPTIKKAH